MRREVPFNKMIGSEEELRALVGYPSEIVTKKVVRYLDEHCRTFISLSPFLTMSTADKSGFCDVSPRGDSPGFVLVLNKNYLIIPERPGNKRVDSLSNIISNPKVGLLFFIPGLGETLRVNGKAFIVKDEELLKQMAVNGKTPMLAVAVEVNECFIHCAKAFKRSRLWDSSSWHSKAKLPSAANMLRDHTKLSDYLSEDLEEMLKEDYKELY
ncbi:phosphohydrolase [Robertmurraya siralis]|uniref:Phosphohydrolase n=1 Tax=Robertmurraya siralis TaxID=77777 RepID=A0A919WJX5_9BACI|nr:pyridoxamine 5'-phosphate oxidase family protein [Robertmurraya siralis]GIN63143.1 phosphohydrolase [Robertmurraya siralis]